jgi:hypothetical protein
MHKAGKERCPHLGTREDEERGNEDNREAGALLDGRQLGQLHERRADTHVAQQVA